LYGEVVKICKNESSIHEILKKEKEICASFAVTPPTEEIVIVLFYYACCELYTVPYL
jgi:hypothetical protein